ncbi:hypothetical protein QTP70_017957 [Hemibagrus guttatus]|uniref:Ig-like domain-containing protein n=1 Tax=Hemibagrus guttatus TaxID=175788 RepID=A0AAE0QGB6_9TELE|nr:hypothetical protein QTP70_017957 [Hemibagrus guttatus]
MISTSLLLLLLAAVHCVHCVELIQTGSTVLTPGQSLTLTCKVSGYSLTDSSYCTDWIRQPAGKTLEWIGDVCYTGGTYYSVSSDEIRLDQSPAVVKKPYLLLGSQHVWWTFHLG